MILGLLLGTSLLVNGALGYAVWNMLRKNEMYEQAIGEFYSALSIVLHSMRSIDEKQMFESDDEVGTVFNQLTDIIGTLRPLLYGIPDAETTDQE